MGESAKTRRFCDKLKERNFRVYVLAGGSRYQQSGLPDRYVCGWGVAGWLEFKDEKTRVRPLQKKVIGDMRERGANACILRFVPGGYRAEDEKGNILHTGDEHPAQFIADLWSQS